MVADEFDGEVAVEGILGACEVDLDTVINDEIDGDEGLDDGGIGSGCFGGVTHGGEVYNKGDAGKILKDDAGYGEGDLVIAGGLGLPVGEVFDVGFGDFSSVEITKEGLENDADGNREAGDIGDAEIFEGRKRVVGGIVARAGFEDFFCFHDRFRCAILGQIASKVNRENEKWGN